MSNKKQLLKDKIKKSEKDRAELQKQINSTSLTIYVLGDGFPLGDDCLKSVESCNSCSKIDCRKPKRRKIIKDILTKQGNEVLFPEDLKLTNPSIEEQIFFQDADLLIILPESEGSISEFTNLSKIQELSFKLRVFVPLKYHPLYGTTKSYVSDAYLTYLTEFGHVYYFNEDKDLYSIIIKLTESYRKICYRKKLVNS